MALFRIEGPLAIRSKKNERRAQPFEAQAKRLVPLREKLARAIPRYAVAGFEDWRAVLDCQALRRSSLCLRTKDLASSKLA
jgi:hypothetical protein